MRFTLLLLGAVLLSSAAHAFDAKKFHISYFQETESASTEMGNKKNTITTFRQASFRYKLNDTWTARIDLRDETTDQIEDGSGDVHDRVNPRIGVQAVVWKKGRYSLFTQFLADVVANLHVQGSDRIIRPRIYNSLSIDLTPKQNLAVAFAVRRYIYQPGEDDQYDLQWDGFTEITYRVTMSDLITLQAYYFSPINSRKDHSQFDLIQSEADLDLGVEFNFKDVGTFMPYLGYNFQTINETGADSHDEDLADVSLGFWLSTRFF